MGPVVLKGDGSWSDQNVKTVITVNYADVMILDPYHPAVGAEVYEDIALMLAKLPNKKPVMTLLQTYTNYSFHFNTPDDVRNNNYQALLAGIDGLGYFRSSIF